MGQVLPPFGYYGSKVRMAPTIVGLLPAHVHYVEPFAGSLAVLLAKAPSKMETINDIDAELVTFWRVLRDRPDELLRACELTPYARQEFAEAHAPAVDELEIARRVWVRLTQGRNGSLNNHGWRHRIDADGHATVDSLKFLDRLAPVARRILGCQIECRPALDVIADYGQQSGVLLYVDPPYLAETRAATHRYRYEMDDQAQHADLAAALRACAATVVLSGYRSALYDGLYAGWFVEEIPAQTSNGGAGKPTCEVLWSNRMMGGRQQVPLWD